MRMCALTYVGVAGKVHVPLMNDCAPTTDGLLPGVYRVQGDGWYACNIYGREQGRDSYERSGGNLKLGVIPQPLCVFLDAQR